MPTSRSGRKAEDVGLEKGLPTSLDTERLVLGSIFRQATAFAEVEHLITPDDFSLEKHRVIFRRMLEMRELGEEIDRITLATHLHAYGELEKIDGLTYLNSLDDGLPEIFHVDAYARIVKEKSVLRQTIFRCQHIMNQCFEANIKPQEILGDAVEQLTELNLFDDKVTSVTPGQVVTEYPGGIDAFLRPQPGIATGFPLLDDVLYGLQPECVYVIGADTSVGKSSLAMNIAYNIVLRGEPVLYFSLEMSRDALVRRMISSRAHVPLHDIMTGEANLVDIQGMKDAFEGIAGLSLYIDEDPYCSASDIRAKTEQHLRKHKIKLAVIDYLQIMDWQSKRAEMPRFRDEREALTYITKRIHQYSKELHLPIILVSQLSRGRTMRSAKDLRPKLRDLHGSSTIEKDADSVILIYREEMDHPTKMKIKGRAEAIVAKNRNGRLGTVHMKFTGEFTQFEETAPPEPEPTEGESHD